MSAVVGTDIEYALGAFVMNGYLSVPADGAPGRPGVLIVHDAFGLDAHCIGVADRLAAMGYAAFALDLWGGRRQLDSGTVMGPLGEVLGDRAMWMARVEAARGALVSQPGVDGARIAAIGYCLGGSTVLEFARTGGAIAGAVSFHGGLDMVGAAWDGASIGARLLVCTGAEDPLVPWATVTEFQDNVRRGDVDWELDVYARAKHSFTRPDAAARSSPDRSAYDAQADRRSWRAMAHFLAEIFDG